MNFEEAFGVADPRKEAKWFTHDDGGEFLIAPLNNNLQVEETMKLTKVKEDIDNKTLFETKELSCKVLARSILLDWKDIKDSKGKEMKYSPKNGEDVLIRYNSFTAWIIQQATDLVASKEEEKEALVKN